MIYSFWVLKVDPASGHPVPVIPFTHYSSLLKVRDLG